MATVRISGNWRNPARMDFAGTLPVDAAGKIERSVDIPEEAFVAIERDLAKGSLEGQTLMPNGTRFNWFVDR